MQQQRILAIFTFVFVVILLNIEMSHGICCDHNCGGLFCCSNGPCNILCCNCDAPCISSYSLFSSSQTIGNNNNSPLTAFKKIDSNSDGSISKTEAISYLVELGHNLTDLENETKWFNEIDTNKNGLIEKNELDKDF